MSRIYGRLIVVLIVIALMVLGVVFYDIDKGLDLAGGLEIHYEIRSNVPGSKVTAEEVIPILRRRIDPEGLLNPQIERMDDHKIRVQLPGIEPEEQQAIAQRISRLGKLEFRLVEFVPGEYDSVSPHLGMRARLLKAQEQGQTRVGPEEIDGVTYWWDYLPEVRYEKDVTYRLRSTDILEPRKLARQIRDQGRLGLEKGIPSPARRIWQLLDEPGRETIRSAARRDDEATRTALASVLGELIRDREFYTEEDFEGVDRGDQLGNLLDEDPGDLNPEEVLKRNRLLLEAAFPTAISRSRRAVTVVGHRWVRGSENMITGTDLSRVEVAWQNMQPVIAFGLRGEAAQRMGDLTGNNVGKRLAVVLDNEIRQAPNVRARITTQGVIEGGFTRREAEQAVEYIRQGSLPVTPVKVAEYYVGPTLGQDLIQRSWTAAWICLVAVALFMILYYRLSGVVAVLGLALNLLIILGVMALTGQTLWLAGIVGILLTVGMSVDANVLIFERIREEQERGRAFSLSVANGYGRAFSAITDANITTLFTALALYMTDMPSLKSFSFTLGVGIVGSMFCALYFTRIFFDWFVESRIVERVKMMKLIGESHFPFMRVAHTAIAISGVGILVGLYLFFLRSIETPLDYALKVLVVPSADMAGGIVFVIRLVVALLIVLGGLWLAGRVRRASMHDTPGGAAAPPAGRDPSREGRSGWFPLGVIGAYVLAAILTFYVYDNTPWGEGEYTAQTVHGIKKNLNIDLRSGARLQLQLAREGEMPASEVEAALADAGFEGATAIGRRLIGGGDQRPRTAEYVVEVPADRDPEAVAEAIRSAFPERVDPWDVVPVVRENVREVHFGLKRTRMAIETIRARLEKAGVRDFSVQSWSGAQAVAAQEASPQFSIATSAATDQQELDDLKRTLVNTFRDAIDYAVIPVTFDPPAIVDAGERLSVTAKVVQSGAIERQITRTEILAGLERAFGEAGFDLREVPMDEGKESFESFSFTVPMTALGAETIERVGNDPEALQEVLQERYAMAFRSPRAFSSSNFLSASEAVRTVGRAMIAIFLSLFGIVAYVWLRFGNIRFGLAAILALVHDVLITMGLVALADMLSPTPIGELLFIGDVKIGLATVAAFLTLIGYSLNDTIVVFDRIRENITGGRKLVPDIVNNSINQMLGRTILTSVTTLIVVLVQYIWGGPSIHSLCFVLICGVVVGTYSSIFIASPVLIWGALWGRSRE